MRRTLTRAVAGVAAIAVASIGLLGSVAQALPEGTAAAGSGTLSPLTGTNLSSFSFLPPTGSVCPGDSTTGGGGYRWTTFMVADSVDPATLTYDLSGPVAQGGAYTQPLYDTGGTPVIARNTAISTGLLTGLPAALNFASNTMPVPNGEYNIGYACTQAGVTMKFWVTPILISNSTATSFNYSLFAVPGAPVLDTVTNGVSETLSGTFTAPASTPATLSYTVTATPPSGPAVTLVVPAPATGFTLPGLTNGTTYGVTVRTTNDAGTGPVSNSISMIVEDDNQLPPVVLGQVILEPLAATINWTAPAVAPTLAPFYNVVVTGGTATVGTLTAGSNSVDLTDLIAGDELTVSIEPLYVLPFFSTPAVTAQFTVLSNSLIIQDITVVRPEGALVLTQVCGVYGPLAEEPASTGFPLLDEKTATTYAGGGGASGATGPTLTAGGSDTDPNYTNSLYPSPEFPEYPTHCGLDLGEATLVTTGTEAGQYYAAHGQINQVTVSDTRNASDSWTVNGTMSDFVQFGNTSETFPGSQLGWTPKVNGMTPGQNVVASARILPGTTPGLTTASPLAVADDAASLGIAHMDARLRLLIPVAVPSGTYNATLTFSVV